MAIAALTGWTSEQKHVVAASFLGWTFDAFDFFVLVFVLRPLAETFGASVTELSFRNRADPGDAAGRRLSSGRAADRYGRRPILMVDVLFYSVIELASAYAPTLPRCSCCAPLRGRDGRQWGVGRLAHLRGRSGQQARGIVSGILQRVTRSAIGRSPRSFALLFPSTSAGAACSWSDVIPDTTGFFIRRTCPESPVWKPRRLHAATGSLAVVTATGGPSSSRSC